MEEWIAWQAKAMAGEWETAVSRFYPRHAKTWEDPAEQFRALKEEWNALDAVRVLDWRGILGEGKKVVLDVGAGTGWLSAFLSRFPSVERIDALDSGRHNLEVMLPAMLRLMEGDAVKVRPVLGFFTPLPPGGGLYDLVVGSSSFHHAAGLSALLKECRRVLKKDGTLVVLNETPLGALDYQLRACRAFLSILLGGAMGKDEELSPALSRSGLLYDPYLGDHWHSRGQWERALRRAGFSFETAATPFPPYKNGGRSPRLTHFICRPAGGV